MASGVRTALTGPSAGAFCVSAGCYLYFRRFDGVREFAIISPSEQCGGEKMGTKETQQEIQQLKKELKATNKANDSRLLKLAFVLAIVAVIAGIMHGRIQLW